MTSPRDIATLKKSSPAALSALGRFVDRLLQSFEDCRSGLSNRAIAEGDHAVENFFRELYERERERLFEAINDQPLLTDDAKLKLRIEVDERIQKVIIPAYVRHARAFTGRERNDFYLSGERYHVFERIAFGALGILVGLAVIAAPFIPLWSKEWVIPFMIGGLLFPNIRRYFALRKYERQLNELVLRSDRELARLDIAYLTAGDALQEEERKSEQEYQRKLAAARAAEQQSNKEP